MNRLNKFLGWVFHQVFRFHWWHDTFYDANGVAVERNCIWCEGWQHRQCFEAPWETGKHPSPIGLFHHNAWIESTKWDTKNN